MNINAIKKIRSILEDLPYREAIELIKTFNSIVEDVKRYEKLDFFSVVKKNGGGGFSVGGISSLCIASKFDLLSCNADDIQRDFDVIHKDVMICKDKG